MTRRTLVIAALIGPLAATAAVAAVVRAAPPGLPSAAAAIEAADVLARPSRPTPRGSDRDDGGGAFSSTDPCATVAAAYRTGAPNLPLGATSVESPLPDRATLVTVSAPYGPTIVVLAPQGTGCSYRLVDRPNVAVDIPGSVTYSGFLPVACVTLIAVPVVYAALPDGSTVAAALDADTRTWKAGRFRLPPGADASALLTGIGQPEVEGPLDTDAPVPTDERPALSITGITGTFPTPDGPAGIALSCTHFPRVSIG